MTVLKIRNKGFSPSVWHRNDDLFNRMEDFLRTPSYGSGYQNSPAVNIYEGDKDFRIDMAVPGINKKDMNIDVDDRVLTISRINEENKESGEDENYCIRQFDFGAFEKRFTLPESADADKISATYKDGILSVNIPKRAEAQSIRKEVRIS